MEPPAKRMRLLHSVEVDEDNAEYIKAKQKQQQKLKSRFESIFEKFGNMNPSQSDEIDFNTNRVVVDRGHLRRLKRRVNGKEKTLLESIVMGDGSQSEDDGDDEEKGEGEDSADELAPPQLVKPKAAGSPEQDTSKQQTAATETNAPQPAIPQHDLPATSIPQSGVPQTPNPPNPTADLLRHLQFPQTPAGQQAQSAFHASLLQTIHQAVNQAVAGLVLPNASIPFANAAPLPITPITTDDKVAPATDPKWFFPPLSAQPRQCPVAQSSPLPSYTTAPTAKETGPQHSHTILRDVPDGKPCASIRTRPDESSPTRPRRTSPRVEIQRRIPRTARIYSFTHEDDVYISMRKAIDGVSWAVIKDGQQKWKEWPMSAFHNRWNVIKNQNLHLLEPAAAPTSDRVVGEDQVSKEQNPAVSKPPHHLPTPSSSEHEDYHQSLVVRSTEDGVQNLRSSSTHFNDDDRDLLSLAGDDSDEDQLPMNHDDDDTIVDVSEDVILPSIETRDLVDEDILQNDLLAELPTHDTIATPVRESSCIAIKVEPAFSSPTTLRTRKHATPLAEVIPDLQTDLVLPSPHNIENKSPGIAKPDAVQTLKEQNTHVTSNRKSPSLDLIGTTTEDELLPSPPNPTTPSLNRAHEPATPRTAVPFTTYQTPKIRNADGSSDKGSKSTSKADRKAFHKRIKREWTRKGTPAKDSTAKKRSLGGLEVRKRRWVDVDGEGSEDELAKF